MSSGVDVAARPLDRDELEDVAAEPDHRHRPASRRRSPGPARRRAAGSRRTSGDGRPGVPSELAGLLDDQAGRHELADEPADAAAGQPGALHELRARERSVGVQHLHERAEVGPPDRLAALPLSPVTEFVPLGFKTLVTGLPHRPVSVKRAAPHRCGSIRSCAGSATAQSWR